MVKEGRQDVSASQENKKPKEKAACPTGILEFVIW